MAIAPFLPASRLGGLLDELFVPFAGTRAGSFLRMPEAEVMETEDAIRVNLELPGLKPADVEVTLENNVLTVSGEKKEERGENGGSRWHLAERRYGSFSRSFVLPSHVEQDRIAARFEDGVLSITVPKGEAARRRRVQIGGGGSEQQTLGPGQSR
jgi:HSP20 family protein